MENEWESDQESKYDRFEKMFFTPDPDDTTENYGWPGHSTPDVKTLIDKWGREVFLLDPANKDLLEGNCTNPLPLRKARAYAKKDIYNLIWLVLGIGLAGLLLPSSFFGKGHKTDIASAPILIAIGLGFLILGVLAWLVGLHALHRLEQLIQNGQLLPAETNGIATKKEWVFHKGSRAEFQYWIILDYQFTTPSGELIQAQIRNIRNDLSNQPLPGLTIPVVVLYKNNKNYIVL